MRNLVFIAWLALTSSVSAADYVSTSPYRLSPDERAMAVNFAAAATAALVCKEDGVRLNRGYFSSWASQYAVRDAGRNAAFREEINRARSDIAVQLATTPADDWCDSYLDRIEDTAAPYRTPVYWNDPLGQFNGAPTQEAIDVWNFFNE
jgi:hypothetical protein